MKLAEFSQDKYRFSIYDNKSKLTWQKVREKTGCYAIVNLGYFSLANFSIQDAIMVGGQWLEKPAWGYDGIRIDKNGTLTVGRNNTAEWDYCNGEPCYYLDGKAVKSSTHYGKNGMTMLGVKADGTVVIALASKDAGETTKNGCKALLERGCKDILRYDGSWSSQGSLGPGMDVQPSQRRIVRTYLLIYERNDNKEEVTDVTDIKQFFMTKNPCYTKWKNGTKIIPKGIMVHSTAAPGAMAKTIVSQWDNVSAGQSVHAVVDDTTTIQALPWDAKAWHAGTAHDGGPSANVTHLSFEMCEPQECRLIPIEWEPLKRGSSGWAVKRLQQELTARGYDPNGVDGSFGAGCEAAVKKFQKDAKLGVDGSVGPATLKVLANRTGSYLKYDPTKTADYFAAAWERAVALCAKLCTEYGFDPEKDILCHQEGNQKGIASNHADVLHWWPLHGKSMDDFRAAVKAAMGTPSGKTVVCPHCGKMFTL